MQMEFRIASRSDVDEIVALVNRAYRPAPGNKEGWTHESDLVAGARTSTEQVLALFTTKSCILVSCVGAKIVACVHLQSGQSGVCIGMLATDPAIQSRGVGKQMLLAAEQYAAEHFNASTAKITVLSSRPELLAFYKRRGYICTGEVDDYPTAAGAGRPLLEGLKVMGLAKMLKN